MTAAAQVVRAAGGHGWAKSNAAARPKWHSHQPHQVEQHRKLLVEALGAMKRLHGHQPPQPLLLGHQAFQQASRRLGIGIEEHEHLPPTALHAVMQSPGFAAPAGREGRGLNQPQRQPVCRGLGDGCGAITGVIVDHDDVQRLQGLRSQTLQQVMQGAFFIAGGDQHRHRRCMLQAQRRQRQQMP